MKEIEKLRAMPLNELESKLFELRKEQFSLRMKKSAGTLDKTHPIAVARKSIARVKTLITEKAGSCNDK